MSSQISLLRKVIREQLQQRLNCLTESVCSACGDPNAYIGFLNKVECPNKACPKFSQQQFDDIHRGPATPEKAGHEWYKNGKYHRPDPNDAEDWVDKADRKREAGHEHYDRTDDEEQEILDLLMQAQTYELNDENDLDMLRDLGYIDSNSRELTQMGRDALERHLKGLDPFESF